MISIYFERAGRREHLGDYNTEKEAYKAAQEAIQKKFKTVSKYWRSWISETDPSETYSDFGSWSTYLVKKIN